MKRCLQIFLGVAVLCAVTAHNAPAHEIRLGEQGLLSIQVDGQEILKNGQPGRGFVVFEETELDHKGFKKYQFEKLAEKPAKVEFNAAQKLLTHAYSWGAVEFQYKPGDDRLDIAVTIRNTSKRMLADFSFPLMEICRCKKHWPPSRCASRPNRHPLQ